MSTTETQHAELLALLREGCRSKCTYEESDGELFRHCEECQFKITSLAHQLLVTEKCVLVAPPSMAQRFTVVLNPNFHVSHENWYGNGTTMLTIKRVPNDAVS